MTLYNAMSKELNLEISNNKKEQTINLPKKRGRPRKHIMDDINKDNEKKKALQFDTRERELILHLPVFLSSSQKKEQTDNNTDNGQTESAKFDLTTIIETESPQEVHSDDEAKIFELENIIIKKDKIIKKLRDDLVNQKNNSINSNTGSHHKEIRYRPLNLKLFNLNGDIKTVEKTETCCWWCTYSFDNLPVFIPDRLDDDKMYVFGCFCSYNCACAYNFNMNDYKTRNRYSLIKYMLDINDESRDIYMAPSREILKKYGGDLSIEEYRKNFIICNKEYRLLELNLVPMNMVIEEKSL